MKYTLNKLIAFAVLACAGMVMGQTMPAPENPATGIWIQQVGEISPHNATKATLHYTLFGGSSDRVKSVDYYYDGAGWLNLYKKEVVCATGTGDGIAHHPDGDLLVAGQGNAIHKVSKTARAKGQQCLLKTSKHATTSRNNTNGFWHLMMDPNGKTLWAAGIPGYLFRFSTETNVNAKNFADYGYKVDLKPSASSRRKDYQLSTLIWDEAKNVYFTYSDYVGGGCETDADGHSCTQEMRDYQRSSAYFGMITDTTWTTVTQDNQADYGGKIGEKVITSFGTKILIDSLEGAHGGTYDPYSKTIFLFGGSKIVQVKPYMKNGSVAAEVVATIDLRKYFFEESNANLTGSRTPSQGDGNTASWSYVNNNFGNNCNSGNCYFTKSAVGWRLDQGTVDGHGHLFVASNTGHLVFVDYAANPNKYINDNVLVHLQWIDNYLDDLAPLDGVGVVREEAGSGTETIESSSAMSSPNIEYEESSSSKKSSSSSAVTGSSSSKGNSSGSTGGSSGSVGSSGSTGDSSGSTGGSSGSEGSSGSTGGSSGSIGGSSGSVGSSGSTGGSSGSIGGSSGSEGSSGSTGGSSGSEGSSGSTGGSSGSVGSSGSTGGSSGSFGSSGSNGSSSSGTHGSGSDVDLGSSSSNRYNGFIDFDMSSSAGGIQFYPSPDKFDKGDTIVTSADVLRPSTKPQGTPGTITIGENVYEPGNTTSDLELNLNYNSGIDSAQVGQVVGIVLDKDKIASYLGTTSSELTFVVIGDIDLVDQNTGEKRDTLDVVKNGDVSIWVTADKPVRGAQILVYDKTSGQSVIIDNINFYDPVPEADSGYLKDTNNDDILNYLEIVLKDTLPQNMAVQSISIVPSKGKSPIAVKSPVKVGTIQVAENETSTKKVNTLSLDVSGLKLTEDKVDESAYAIVYFKSPSGTLYKKEVPLRTGVQIIKAAYAIRNKTGKDSLFIEYNVNLSPVDLVSPEQLVMLKQGDKQFGFVGQISKVYLPTKNLIILVGDSLGLKGDMKDSVSLHPSVNAISGSNINYITSEEYDREIPVKVIDRLPSIVNVEYWDTDGDGVLDQVVANFSGKLSAADLEMLHMEFPWYSERGLQIPLQASPDDLTLDPKNPTKVTWNVHSPVRLAKGVTSISESLAQASIFTYYPVLGHTFVSEEHAPLVDKMAPLIAGANLSYGRKADTLLIVFTEAIQFSELKDKGKEAFSYIHGKDTLDLLPKDIIWAPDGFTAKLILDGNVTTVLPGDSLKVVKGAKVQDNYGNVMGEKPQPVVITGLLNHLVESTKMGYFDANSDAVVHTDSSKNYTLQTVSSVNLRYVPSTTTKEDMEKEGALGQLIQLGERFVPQLLDRAQISADGTVDPSVLDSLKPEDVFITFVVNYYDHLGQYVNDTTIMVSCKDFRFGGNCLNTDKKLFVNWNFKDHKGRFVGSGVYNVQFKMVIRYKKKKIEEEIKDKWGVRRKKNRKK